MIEETTTSDCISFAKSIDFRFVQPHLPVSKWWRRVAAWYRRFGGAFDFLNARIPKQERGHSLAPLKHIPRMSTAAIGAIINRGVAEMRPNEAFVNVGVWNGFTFLSGMVGNPDKICIGVDNFSQFGGPKDDFLRRFERFKSFHHRFYDLDYKHYFAEIHRESIGFYLYDGEHSFQNQLDGLRVAEPFFGPRCVIMVDDTNDDEPRQATLEFMNTSQHRYEIVFDATTHGNHHPTWWNGLMLLRRF